jgi:hypothetical protein
VRRVRLLLIVATLAVAAAFASSASATRSLQLGITDSGSAYYANPDLFYPVLGSLHAQVLRVQLYWGGGLGVVGVRPKDATDPTDPSYDWSRYDGIVLRAADEGVEVLFSIFGTPAWANGGELTTHAPKHPIDLQNFAYAAATRYSGTFERSDGTILPRVRLWSAWNEPNLPIGLVPQWKKVKGTWTIQSAIDYARICNAIVRGVHGTLVAGDRVACGDTAPRGNNAPTSSRPTTSPLAFLRAMKRAGARGFDAFAHHPYPSNPSETPTTRPTSPTAVTFGNLDVLVKELTQLYGRKPLWLDEYGYQTNPPDHGLGVSPTKQAKYLTESVALARANPRVTMLLWFLVRDDPRLSGWQSGLETARGVRKPAFAAFARAALDPQ